MTGTKTVSSRLPIWSQKEAWGLNEVVANEAAGVFERAKVDFQSGEKLLWMIFLLKLKKQFRKIDFGCEAYKDSKSSTWHNENWFDL